VRAFLPESVAGTAAVGLEIQQQSQIVLLPQHQDGTKQGWRCSRISWSLEDIWTAFPWVQLAELASPMLRETF